MRSPSVIDLNADRVFFSFHSAPPFIRCGLSGGSCLPPRMGRSVLDQLHYIQHQQTHRGPEQTRSLQKAACSHHVWRWPSTSASAGWVPKVSDILLLLLYTKHYDIALIKVPQLIILIRDYKPNRQNTNFLFSIVFTVSHS